MIEFPSFGENFSMALLEVMALGRITITSSIPSFREVIIDYENGFIANDESEYIERIDYIFKTKNINSIKVKAYNTVKVRFNNRNIVLDNIKYYESIMNKKNIFV